MPAVSAFVRALPKIQLHCHLEGTVRAETFRDLAALRRVESARAAGPLAATYAFATFREFLLTFAEVCKALQQPEDYARIAREYARDAAAQRVCYAEVFISPSVWRYFHHDLDVAETVAAIRTALDGEGAAHDLEVKLICDLTRNFGTERAFETARGAVELAEAGLGVVGIGLGGDEVNFPPSPYREAFDYARAHGLRCVAHAGEAAGPQSVRGAVEVLHAERIGHGVRAIEDPALVTELAERHIALEVCPTSNHLTAAVAPGEPHPLIAFDAAGIRCAIDADDPALFSTTLSGEYALVASWLGEAALPRFVRHAIDASFADAARKAALHQKLDAYGLETVGTRRSSSS